MATRGYIIGSLTQRDTYYRPVLYWARVSYSIEGNYSVIRVYSFVDDWPTSNDGTPLSSPMDWNGNCSSYTLTVDGQNITHATFYSDSNSGWTHVGWSANPYDDLTYGSYRTELITEAWAGYHEFTIYHNSDGTKTAAISHSYSLPSGGYGPGNVSFSGNITLDTIPRASSLNSFDAFTIDDASAKNLTVRTTSFSAGFNLDFSLWYGGNLIASWNDITPTVGSEQTHSLSLSIAQQQALMNLITTAASGSVTMALVTQSGSTQIGSTQYRATTAYLAASIVPTISSFTNTELTTSPVNIATVIGKYVKSLSNIRLTGSGAGRYGSTITGYNINLNGVNYGAATIDTGIINWSGDKTATLTVTDSRGRTAQSQVTLNALDYTPPAISSFIVQRCDSGGTLDPLGTYVKVTRVGSAASLINGTEKNTVAAKVYYKDRAGVSPASWTEVYNPTSMRVEPSSNVSGAVALPAINSGAAIALATKSYDFKLEVTDKFGTTTSQLVLSTGKVIMAWGTEGVGIGKFPDAGYVLDVADTVKINGQLYLAQAAGTAPMVVPNSTTKVANLNVDAVDGMHADTTAVTDAATHYLVQTAADNTLRPKALANVRAEIVTEAAVESALSGASQAWQTPTLLNSWVNYDDTTYNPAGYWKDAFGVVHLRGLVSGGTIGANIFVLPEGYRPAKKELLATISNNAIGRLNILADGGVYASTPSVNTWVSLDSITFRAA